MSTAQPLRFLNQPRRMRLYNLNNFEEIPEIAQFSPEDRFAMRVVAQVLPFKVNDYVVNELIDWSNIPDDPIFRLTFPQRGMLRPAHFDRVAHLLKTDAPRAELKAEIQRIRMELNPHPAGQQSLNVPRLDGMPVEGVQHKYRETMLLFPREAQTCHTYCTYCFRWAQFVGDKSLKFETKTLDRIIRYVESHPELTDVLVTGGDPMIMRTATLEKYLEAFLDERCAHIKNIRIGTKALSWWPHRFVSDPDSEGLLRVLGRIVDSGKHVAIMAHLNHSVELSTPTVREAIAGLRDVGCEIRTQAPLTRFVNDSARVWADLIRTEVNLGLIPYYMFVSRDTGAQHYFSVPLARALGIYRKAIRQVSGLARTMRGPSMSAKHGKIEVLDITELNNERVFALRMLQARNPVHVGRIFYAKYDADATWIDDLRPAFGAKVFPFEEESLPV